jgi:hypothetical protein
MSRSGRRRSPSLPGAAGALPGNEAEAVQASLVTIGRHRTGLHPANLSLPANCAYASGSRLDLKLRSKKEEWVLPADAIAHARHIQFLALIGSLKSAIHPIVPSIVS